jgi:hypothetical protein
MSKQVHYVLRFVQHFNPADEGAFMTLERQFAELEKSHAEFPKGRRLQSLSGAEPRHTLIWECEMPSLAAVGEALATMSASADHDRLFQKQAPTMVDSFTEIYEVLDM